MGAQAAQGVGPSCSALLLCSPFSTWPQPSPADMIELLSKSKLGALELAAMSLKATGTCER